MSGICVDVSQSGGIGTGSTETSSNGQYVIDQLPAGKYTVYFWNCTDSGNYVEQYYDNQPTYVTANLVQVSTGATASSIDATLRPGGVISGTVTSAASGSGSAGLCVDAQEIGGNGYGGEGVTAADGTYSVASLPTGSYAVGFGPCGDPGGYTVQWYNDQANESSADPVSVTVGTTTGPIDAAMQ